MHGDMTWLYVALLLANPFVWLALGLTALQVLDGITTYHIIKLGGVEKNMLMQWLMFRFGVYRTLLLTKGGAAVLAWVLALVPISGSGFGNPHAALGYVFIEGDTVRLWALVALTVWYAMIAAHNYNAYCKMKERR